MPSAPTSKRYVGIESYSPLATEIVQNAALRRKLYARTLLEMGTESLLSRLSGVRIPQRAPCP